MNLLLAILITLVSVIAGTSLCFYLLYKVHEVEMTTWILEHVLCPLMRIVVLLIVVSQVYPLIDQSLDSLHFWHILGQQNQLRDMVNILFIAGLLLAFIPLVNHPLFMLPLQSMFTIALVFHWQYFDSGATLSLFPSAWTIVKIVLYMLLAWFAVREFSGPLSRLIDDRFHISGSIRLVSDSIYMVLQIPVMLFYGSFLIHQLP